MNTKENKRSLIVGLFTLIGLVILVAGILVLGTQQNKFSKNLVVKTYFSDVKGLKVGNNVWFSGVKVGIIKEIAFENIDKVKVVMTIQEKDSQFIRKNVIATLGSDGLIGNSIISLVGGSADFPKIETNDIIKSGPSGGMDHMVELIQDNGENLTNITQNLARISQDLADGKGTMGALISDSKMSQDIKESIASLREVMNGTNLAMNNLVKMTQKLNREQGLLHDLTTDTVLFATLKQSAEELQGVTQTAAELVNNLNKATENLNNKDNVMGLLINDKQTAEVIKEMLNNLNSSSEKLDENMEALQSNFLLRGYFKKKAKEDKKANKQ